MRLLPCCRLQEHCGDGARRGSAEHTRGSSKGNTNNDDLDVVSTTCGIAASIAGGCLGARQGALCRS
jgi:hypothetical protein